MVLATQNPIEYEGTFPLPEAQLDRFMMKISIGYPDLEEEKKILRRFKVENPIDNLKAVISGDEILEIQRIVREVYVDESIDDYIVNIVRATRENKNVQLGASPRGSLSLFRAAQAWAVIHGREYVIPDDVKQFVKPVLSHRIIIKPEGKLMGIEPYDVLENILEQVRVPVVKRYV